MTPPTPPPYDPALVPTLEAVVPLLPSPMTLESIPGMRAASTQTPPTDAELRRDGRFAVETRFAPGWQGDPDVQLLVARPTAPATDRRGCVYFVHGGGMVTGSARVGMLDMLDWSERFDLVVVSVEYRLAPEHPHPAPIDDCWAGLRWTAEHAGELGFDPERLVIAGGSAGGGLTAALALRARDERGPRILGQVLQCPMLDDRDRTISTRQFAGRGIWDRASNETGWRALLGDAAGGPDVSPYAAPARAAHLGGLPPAFIDVGSAEVFRDEDVEYASRIWAAGGRAELHVWPGGFHGFDAMVPDAPISRAARETRLRWLERLLGSNSDEKEGM
jgi:acetyl esterase/lipase